MYQLSNRSLKNISGISEYLQKIVKLAITISEVDFGILSTGGKRTAELQNEIYKSGNSRCDGYDVESYHQSGKAVDLVAYVDGRYTWSNKMAYIKIYDAFIEAEEILNDKGEIPKDVYFHHGIFWKWDDLNNNNALDIKDKIGWDAAHHEQRKHIQRIK